MGEEIKSGELKSKTSRRTNVNTYEKARFYGNLMIARASEPFGTKRSQVQILSPRPKICLKITIFGLFCCLVLLDFLSKIPRFLTKSGFRRTSPLSAAIGRQLIKVD